MRRWNKEKPTQTNSEPLHVMLFSHAPCKSSCDALAFRTSRLPLSAVLGADMKITSVDMLSAVQKNHTVGSTLLS